MNALLEYLRMATELTPRNMALVKCSKQRVSEASDTPMQPPTLSSSPVRTGFRDLQITFGSIVKVF